MADNRILAGSSITAGSKDIPQSEPLLLLPMRLQIRKVSKAAKTRLATLTKERPNNRSIPSGLLRPFAQKINISEQIPAQDEYWIRWYPDDIHFLQPVGRLTEVEKAAWKTCQTVFDNIDINNEVEGKTKYQSISSFLTSLTMSDWTELGTLDVTDSTSLTKMTGWLEVFYRLKEGNLSVKETSFCIAYDQYCLPRVNSGEISYRFPLGWMDMENPDLKTAWVDLCNIVGMERARQLSKFFLSPQEPWDFDTAKGEEEDAVGLLLDRGTKVRTLPGALSLYCIDAKGKISVLVDSITVRRKEIIYGPTELEGTHWITDFKDAVDNGMGIKIDDAAKVDMIRKAAWLVLAGVNTSSDSRTALEEIMRRNHIRNDLSIVEQDSPTNNTEHGKTNQQELPSNPEEMLLSTRMRIAGTDRYANASLDAKKINSLLRMRPSTFSEIQGSELREQVEARAMNLVVWNSLQPTINDYVEELSALVKVPNLIGSLKRFFVDHVRGRGTIPIIRIGNNPYGVLPVMPTQDMNKDGILAEKTDARDGMFNGLLSLKKYFLRMSKDVPTIDDNTTDAYDSLVNTIQRGLVSGKLRASVVDVPIKTFSRPLQQIDFWELDFSSDSRKVNCDIVKESTAANPAYPFSSETQYLNDVFNYPTTRQDLAIDAKSPVLKRILAATITHYKSTPGIIAELAESADVLRRMNPDKLQILFFETLDLFSHRLDAWLTGIADQQLSKTLLNMTAPPGTGIYGWLENPGTPGDEGDVPEFIYCPSDRHAVTASILRAASKSTNADIEASSFQVNLSSRQIRKGTWFLEGLRKGYTSEVLLGYQLERLIYDANKAGDSSVTPVDIYDLRETYPLPMGETRDDNGALISKSTIINGEKFIQQENHPKYRKLKQELVSIKDAASDITIGEVIHQQGNNDRQAAWMDFLDGKTLPPEPQFVKTPRTGTPLVTDVFLALDATTLVAPGSETNPRSVADPILGQFWQTFINELDQWKVNARLTRSDIVIDHVFDLKNIEIGSLDLLIGGEQELANRTRYYLLDQWKSAPATDPLFNSLGAFPVNVTPDELINGLNVKIIAGSPDDATTDVFHLLQTAKRIRSTVLHDPKEGSQTINPNQLPLPIEKDKYVPDANATVAVLIKRFAALYALYSGLLVDLIDKTAPLLSYVSAKIAMLKIRKQLANVKNGTTPDTAISSLIIKQSWSRISLIASDVGQAAGNNWADDMVALVCTPGTSEQLQAAIDRLLAWELLCDSHLETAIASIFPSNDTLLARLSTAGFLRPRLVKLAGAFNVLQSVRLLIETVSDLFQKVETLAENQGQLAATMRRLRISLLQSEEIVSVADSTDINLVDFDDTFSSRVQNITRISTEDASFIVTQWKASSGSFNTFVTTQTNLIRNASPLSVVADGGDGESKISWLTKIIKKATDGDAMPVWRPWLLADESAGTNWPLQLPDPAAASNAKLEIYRKVRPRIDGIKKTFTNRSGFSVFEGNHTPEGTSIQKAAQFFVARDKSMSVTCPCFIKIDSWTETLPSAEEQTSLAIHYESPRNEAPNAIIVAVPSKIDAKVMWKNIDLAKTIGETIELMQMRMVSSEQVKSHRVLGNYLPALIYQGTTDFVPTVPWAIVKNIADPFFLRNVNNLTPQQRAEMATYKSTLKSPNIKLP